MMMNAINDGWGIGWGWIIGFIVFTIAFWLIVKVVNQNYNKPRPKYSFKNQTANWQND